MPRYEFGQGAADTVVTAETDLTLKLAANVAVTLWNAPTGGTNVTNQCVDMNDVALGSELLIPPDGLLPRFLGPEDVNSLWVDGGGLMRVRILGVWVVTGVGVASETQAGVVERATQTEVDAGTDDARYVSPLKLAASNLFVKLRNTAVTYQGSESVAATYTVNDDATSQDTWVHRWAWYFGAVITGHLDKYGQLRANAAKSSTVPLRVENRNATPSANLLEAGVGPDDVLFGVKPDGTVIGRNVGAKVVVLGPTDPVPAGTPNGSLIIRTVTSTTGDTGGSTGGGATPSGLLKDHLHEGTVGALASASGEGYTGSQSGSPTYVDGGAVGTSSLRWPATGGNFYDTIMPQSVDLHLRLYLRLVTSGDTATFLSIAAGGPTILTLRLTSTNLHLRDAAASVNMASGTPPVAGAWVRLELRIGTADATLKVWNTPGSTGVPDQTLTGSFAAPVARPDTIRTGNVTATTTVADIDALAIATQAIGPAVI